MFTIEITSKTEIPGEWETTKMIASTFTKAKAMACEELKWESTMTACVKNSGGQIIWEGEGDFAFIPARC